LRCLVQPLKSARSAAGRATAELRRGPENDCWARSLPWYGSAADIRGRIFRIQPRCTPWLPHVLARRPAVVTADGSTEMTGRRPLSSKGRIASPELSAYAF